MSRFDNASRPSALVRPFLPRDARIRLKHQRIEAESGNRAGWALQIPGVDVRLVKAVDGAEPGGRVRLEPTPIGSRRRVTGFGVQPAVSRWYMDGAIVWDGRQLTVAGGTRTGLWLPEPAGIQPGFDAVEVFQAGLRPAGAGECLDRVAAIVTVGLAGRRLNRIVVLDAEARELGWLPAPYFAEDDLIRLARAAGIAYRSYAFTFGGYSSTRVSPAKLCEALFPRSAQRVKLVPEEVVPGYGWLSDPNYGFGGRRS